MPPKAPASLSTVENTHGAAYRRRHVQIGRQPLRFGQVLLCVRSPSELLQCGGHHHMKLGIAGRRPKRALEFLKRLRYTARLQHDHAVIVQRCGIRGNDAQGGNKTLFRFGQMALPRDHLSKVHFRGEIVRRDR